MKKTNDVDDNKRRNDNAQGEGERAPAEFQARIALGCSEGR